jgi:hypothetical protein
MDSAASKACYHAAVCRCGSAAPATGATTDTAVHHNSSNAYKHAFTGGELKGPGPHTGTGDPAVSALTVSENKFIPVLGYLHQHIACAAAQS